MTKRDVLARVRGLDEERKKAMVCALVGHSRIQSACFGYFNCGRCDALLGDSLAGVYMDAPKVVVIGHDCEVCRHNAQELTWRDRLYVADPFAKPEAK